MDDLDIGFIERKNFRGDIEVIGYKKRQPSTKALIAIKLVERWGLVTVATDGEDTAGRQKTRMETPNELVSRAIETADLLVDAIEQRGWFLEVPGPRLKGASRG